MKYIIIIGSHEDGGENTRIDVKCSMEARNGKLEKLVEIRMEGFLEDNGRVQARE